MLRAFYFTLSRLVLYTMLQPMLQRDLFTVRSMTLLYDVSTSDSPFSCLPRSLPTAALFFAAKPVQRPSGLGVDGCDTDAPAIHYVIAAHCGGVGYTCWHRDHFVSPLCSVSMSLTRFMTGLSVE